MGKKRPAPVAPSAAPMMGPPLYRPLQGGENRPNADGSYSTEITMTDTDPQGRYEVYPSLWMGPNGPVEMSREKAMEMARMYEMLGYEFPRFNDLQSSEDWAVARSHGGGALKTPLARRRR